MIRLALALGKEFAGVWRPPLVLTLRLRKNWVLVRPGAFTKNIDRRRVLGEEMPILWLATLSAHLSEGSLTARRELELTEPLSPPRVRRMGRDAVAAYDTSPRSHATALSK